MLMNESKPAQAILRGLAAGAIGGLAFRSFMRITSGIAPTPPEGALPSPGFSSEENAVAGPRVAQAIDLSAALTWATMYALAHQLWPRVGGAPAAIGLGVLAWIVDDDVVMPLVGLTPSPLAIPPRNHVYAGI